MRGDPNRQKKVKKSPKPTATTSETSISAKSSSTTSTTSENSNKQTTKPDIPNEDTETLNTINNEEIVKKESNPDEESAKYVNIENIQVNVSNEETKLCSSSNVEQPQSPTPEQSTKSLNNLAETSVDSTERKKTPSESSLSNEVNFNSEKNGVSIGGEELETTLVNQEQQDQEYVNPRGVRFVQEPVNSGVNAANLPYGLPCVRELLRFLISLIGTKNSELMISMGLNLITVGLESGIDHIASYQSLLAYVKDDLCKNLYNLLAIDRLSIFTNVLRVTFLLFESLRGYLKLQLEHFMIKFMEIIVSEMKPISLEQKEITIDFLVQMLRIPGFAIELYLNYDCSLNSTNLFEDLTKLLSKVNVIYFFLKL